MKLINDTWREILREKINTVHGFYNSRLLNIKGRIFLVVQSNIYGDEKNIYYVISNYTAFKLTESSNLLLSSMVQWTADDEGQIYFYTSEKMLTLKPNETQLIPVQIHKGVEYAVVDWKNNVWIAVTSRTASELYHLKKGETIPELIDGDIQGCPMSLFTYMAANFVTKKIYFSCIHTLHSIYNIN